MRSTKKHTLQTYTKRVDHEAGSHRPPKAMVEPAVCQICGDRYADRRWSQPMTAPPSAQRKGERSVRVAKSVVCVACKRQADNLPSGYVYISGAFLVAHHDEIVRLLHNEAARAAVDNPLARIMEMQQDSVDKLTVTTTTEHLAQRLGHAIAKAYDGKIRYDFSHENKLARVYWQRD